MNGENDQMTEMTVLRSLSKLDKETGIQNL
jgi:hypothetical protein